MPARLTVELIRRVGAALSGLHRALTDTLAAELSRHGRVSLPSRKDAIRYVRFPGTPWPSHVERGKALP